MNVAEQPHTETYRTCMNVSTLLRDLCQQNLWVMDNFIIIANGASSELTTLHLPTGVIRERKLNNAKGFSSKYSVAECFKVVIGDHRDQKAMIREAEVCLHPSGK